MYEVDDIVVVTDKLSPFYLRGGIVREVDEERQYLKIDFPGERSEIEMGFGAFVKDQDEDNDA